MVSERRAFGERLRRTRERAGISLDSIAHTSKVSAALFAGLERGDCSRWPAGIYGRAYVKIYAEAIGLHGQDTVDEYCAIFNASSGEQPPTAPHRARNRLRLSMGDEPSIRPQLIARRVALAATELVLGVLISSVMSVGLDAGLGLTIACVLSYYVAGRLISDDPLLFWIFRRVRQAHTRPAAAEQPPDDVPVGDAASTTA